MGGWDEHDTQRETGDSGSKISKAFHDARSDAVKSGELDERNDQKLSDSNIVEKFWSWLTGND